MTLGMNSNNFLNGGYVVGMYLNQGNDLFLENKNSEIYIDKSALIKQTNRIIRTNRKYISISRPRRFGKSMAANMLVAYYGRDCDSKNCLQIWNCQR